MRGILNTYPLHFNEPRSHWLFRRNFVLLYVETRSMHRSIWRYYFWFRDTVHKRTYTLLWFHVRTEWSIVRTVSTDTLTNSANVRTTKKSDVLCMSATKEIFMFRIPEGFLHIKVCNQTMKWSSPRGVTNCSPRHLSPRVSSRTIYYSQKKLKK